MGARVPNVTQIFLSTWVVVSICVFMAAGLFYLMLTTKIEKRISGIGMMLMKGELNQIVSPKTGVVQAWHMEEGDKFKPGDVLVSIILLDDPGTIYQVRAASSGVIAEIVKFSNTRVLRGEALVFTTYQGQKSSDLEILGFVSSLEGKRAYIGAPAHVVPTVVDQDRQGFLLGQVSYVGRLPFAKSGLQSLIKIPELADYFQEQLQAEPFVVRLKPEADRSHTTGYKWSKNGPDFELDSGLIVNFSVIYEEQPVLGVIFPRLNNILDRLH